ncbi:rhomboid family intramembrane serine protease [Arenibacterium sp. CAU 1754]
MDRWPITTSVLCLACIAVYVIEGRWVYNPHPSLIEALTIGPFRHGGSTHLGMNLLLLFWGGSIVEPKIGWRGLLTLALACILFGGLAQALLVGPNFIGISGVVLGIGGYAIVDSMPDEKKWMFFLLGLGGFGLEAVLPATNIAVWVHGVSFLIGGASAMFSKLFNAGGSGPQLKPMQLNHLSSVVNIINQVDEDDALDAENTILERGCDGMFVLMERGTVLGVTGFYLEPDDVAENVAWLSWTYLDENRRDEGLGGQMLNDLLGKLNQIGIRKIFMATSDYAEDGVPIYADAHRMYEDFGAKVELVVPDYHAPGEAKIVYGLDNPEYQHQPEPDRPEMDGLRILGAEMAPEADGTLALVWEEGGAGIAGLEQATQNAKGARMAVVALPSDISTNLNQEIVAAGYTSVGKLADFYSSGLHQVWWCRQLTS